MVNILKSTNQGRIQAKLGTEKGLDRKGASRPRCRRCRDPRRPCVDRWGIGMAFPSQSTTVSGERHELPQLDPGPSPAENEFQGFQCVTECEYLSLRCLHKFTFFEEDMEQVAQLSQTDRAAGWVSYGQNRRLELGDNNYYADITSLSSTTVT